jgi:hypothetical protein
MAQIRTATIANGEAVSSAVEIDARNINYEMGSLVLDGTYTNTSFDIQVKLMELGTTYTTHSVLSIR